MELQLRLFNEGLRLGGSVSFQIIIRFQVGMGDIHNMLEIAASSKLVQNN